MNRWANFLSLLPGTTLTILVISIAFLRFYDETDFFILGKLANPRSLEQSTHCGSHRGGTG